MQHAHAQPIFAMKHIIILLSSLLGAMASIPFGMEDALTTANVPEEYLDYVYLLGYFPFITSRSNPRMSYSIYVPGAHYDANPDKNATAARLPLLVEIHGTRRLVSSVQTEDVLQAYADDVGCAVLAPLFPAGLEGPNDLDSYKLMRSRTLRSDLALLSILDEVAYRWPGIDTTKIYLTGFSGGGQFTHRFLYLHPERLAAVSVGAPGRVTHLDDGRDWPIGISNTGDLFDKEINAASIQDVPIQLVIGEEDTEIHGNPEFWDWIQDKFGSNDGLPPMNQTRMDTLLELREEWRQKGIEAQFDIVPGVGHESSSPEIRKTVLDFIQQQMEKRTGQ